MLKLAIHPFGNIPLKELDYSSSSASERCETMRLIYSSKLAKQKVENGELNLTNALKAQRFIRKQKTNHKKTLNCQEKDVLIQSLCGKSTREADKILIKLDPNLVTMRETIKPLTQEYTALHFTVDQESIQMLERMKELKGQHVMLQDIFKLTLKSYLDKNDPYIQAQKQLNKIKPKINHTKEFHAKTARAVKLQQTPKTIQVTAPQQKTLSARTAPTNQSRYTAQKIKNIIRLRAKNQCEHFTADSKRCSSKTKLEFNHIHPYTMGGGNTEENLRLVCPALNKLYAIKSYGKKKMDPYLRFH